MMSFVYNSSVHDTYPLRVGVAVAFWAHNSGVLSSTLRSASKLASPNGQGTLS